MTINDPYNLLDQGFGSMQWNANVQQLMKIGDQFEDQGRLFVVTSASGVLNFSTGPYQRVHVKLVRGAA